MFRLTFSGVVVAAVMAVMTPAPVSAITYEKLAKLTFNGPVQVPGVTLNAGTYRFRLTNAETSRNVLQVLSNDGAIVYAMFNTMPDSRTSITPDPFVTFKETPVGVPPAVHALFYGGEHGGYEFVYPKGGPNMIAEIVPQPEITYEATPAAPPVASIAGLEPEFVVEESAVGPAVEPVPPPEPEEMPRTAGPLPLIAVGGLTSLLAGLGLGLLRRRGN